MWIKIKKDIFFFHRARFLLARFWPHAYFYLFYEWFKSLSLFHYMFTCRILASCKPWTHSWTCVWKLSAVNNKLEYAPSVTVTSSFWNERAENQQPSAGFHGRRKQGPVTEEYKVSVSFLFFYICKLGDWSNATLGDFGKFCKLVSSNLRSWGALVREMLGDHPRFVRTCIS